MADIAGLDIAGLLGHLLEKQGTDLHLKAGARPFIRINGRLQATALDVTKPAETEELARNLLPGVRAKELQEAGETDFAIGISGLGRFRVSVMRQRGSVGIVIRRVLVSPPSFDALGLPAPVKTLAERRLGLIFVTGPAGSGKSTTVATTINHINETGPASVITIEDPIEMLHADKLAFIAQREVGTDTNDHATGVHQAMRHDPDVIYVDRIPNAEVMALVLTAASGRLVIASLPSLNALETVHNVIDFFPPHSARQTRHTLASVLQGVVTQRLLDRVDGHGRVAAFEVMVTTPRIHDAIVEAPGSQDIESLISAGGYYGMQTMDQHLIQLHEAKLVSTRDALSASVHPQELRVQLQH